MQKKWTVLSFSENANGQKLSNEVSSKSWGCISWSWGWELNPYITALQAVA